MKIGTALMRMLNPEEGACERSWADPILNREKAFLQQKREREGCCGGGDDDAGGGADPVVGIALSGGGIRSATFNLGILTVLERLGLLRMADYLSTVSGGGYVGSYVIANRMQGQRLSEADGAENKPLGHLRKYGNYLSPSLGAMSTDTWAMAMVWFRNTSMLQLFLCSVFAVLLLSPRLWVLTLQKMVERPGVSDWTIPLSILAFHVLAGLLCAMLVQSFAPPDGPNPVSRSGVRRMVLIASLFAVGDSTLFTIGAFHPFVNGGTDLAVLAEEFALTLGSCGFYLALFSLGFARGFRVGAARWKRVAYGVLLIAASTAVCVSPSVMPEWGWWPAPLLSAAVAAVFLWIGGSLIFQWEHEEKVLDLGRSLLAGAACGGVSWVGIHTAAGMFGDAAFRAKLVWMHGNNGGGGLVATEDIWRYAMFASPGLLATVGCCIIFLIGMTGRAMPDIVREAWSRLGALVYMKSLLFLIVGVVGVYGPLALLAAWDQWNGYVLASGGVATAMLGLASLLAAQSGGTGGGGGRRRMELVAKLGPWLFIVLLFCAVSLAAHVGLVYAAVSRDQPACVVPAAAEFQFADSWRPAGTRPVAVVASRRLYGCPHCDCSQGLTGQWTGPDLPGVKDLIGYHWQFLGASIGGGQWALLLGITGGLSGLAVFLLWRLDINEFSINRFYRNRLVRCFLGAARPAEVRRPDPVTDFDLGDDIQMADVRRQMESGTDYMMGRETPIPVVNTALNAVGGEDAALAERRAESFFFSPFGAGAYSTGEVDLAAASTGRKAGDVTLGSLVAISGAAANPNMGFHTSPAVAFLLTFFNVRLGWWLGIPKRLAGSYRRGFNLSYVFFELFGTADRGDGYVNLSDGGHFENLGLYELVRRECDLIVIGDGEQDGEYVFESLGMAVRRCRVDFEAEITIDPQPVRPAAPGGLNGRHWLAGKIEYKGGKVGYLLYLKSSFTGREPYDVQQYRLTNPEFPQQSTADQFFDESQFESYRQLGKHAAEELAGVLWAGGDPGSTRGAWCAAARALYAKG